MADSRVLLTNMEDYRDSLKRHLSKLNSEFQQLDNVWQQFSAVYDGDAAEQFRAGWLRTSQNFNDYIDHTERISAILDERIDFLREANRIEGEID